MAFTVNESTSQTPSFVPSRDHTPTPNLLPLTSVLWAMDESPPSTPPPEGPSSESPVFIPSSPLPSDHRSPPPSPTPAPGSALHATSPPPPVVSELVVVVEDNNIAEKMLSPPSMLLLSPAGLYYDFADFEF
ncbi:hypothetical protein K443DRAFT_10767 [Laccaria amethystina LaAM-08-1]|uniref:Unplaced genomic scaffold K443scaffold_193, whole genome shotgun sequence n=1 Tax=Laccaria amethystina LaAM-08-1 TaxID=1095629 RepID=A0A0C9XJ17_9AGAR|nr:hypothetical protein K443DRAFT_10767 [Laccaria amethystina LaAM-08-1]